MARPSRDGLENLPRPDAAVGHLGTRTVAAFGVNWHGRLPITDGWAPPAAAPTVSIERAAGKVTGPPANAEPVWIGTVDGAVFAAAHCDQSLWMDHHGLALFHFDRSTMQLLIDDRGAPEHLVSRVLLDSVMFTVALELGGVALHGAALAGEGGAVLIVGQTGVGKSSLSAALVDIGYRPVADDVIALIAAEDGVISAAPSPPTATVPVHVPVPADDILAAVDEDELWIRQTVVDAPIPVRVIALLATGPAGGRPPVLQLMHHALSIPAGRTRHRFDVLSSLVAQAPIVGLEAFSAPPPALADRIKAAMDSQR